MEADANEQTCGEQIATRPKRTKGRRLTRQQFQFVEELLANPSISQTEAYRRAYPKVRDDVAAGVGASRTLGLAYVFAHLERRRNELARVAEVSPEWVIERLKHEALNADSGNARVRALELIGTSFGMFEKRIRFSGEVNVEVKPAQTTPFTAEELDFLADMAEKAGILDAPSPIETR